MTPLEHYRRQLVQNSLLHDPAQEEAVRHLERVYRALSTGGNTASKGLLRRLLKKTVPPVRGLYLWGGVGRGKTWLMDLFHDTLPFPEKTRMHFHNFMRHTHRELKALAGERNPLEKAAARLAADTRILCFDEFFVDDIADAMILGNLLQALFRRGVCLVTTSNTAPHDLYRDGLQRQRFLPAIDLLHEHCEVYHIGDGTDYRLRALESAPLYHAPLGAEAEKNMQRSFRELAPGAGTQNVTIDVEGRALDTLWVMDDVAWLEFQELCGKPRGRDDYLELARLFHALLISGVSRMGAEQDDQARRFIHLIDVLYDHNVKLVLSADAAPAELYTGERLQREFQRTASRLQEMQTHEYLVREHRG